MSATMLVVAVAALAFAQLTSSSPSEPIADPVIPECTVEADRDIPLPAEEAGVLVEVLAREGAEVTAGDLLARIDDRVALAQVAIAEANFKAANERAKNDVDLRYSRIAAAVAEAELEMVLASNRQVERAVSKMEVEQKRLAWERSKLATEKAEMDRSLAGLDANAKQQELAAANLAVGRREIRAPFSGEVVTMQREEGEWVTVGDKVMRLVRFDVLQVHGWVDARRYLPHEIDKCLVEVVVELARGKKVVVEGRITNVSNLVDHDQTYQVRAEIKNRQHEGHWIVRPGLTATMTIKLGSADSSATAELNRGPSR